MQRARVASTPEGGPPKKVHSSKEDDARPLASKKVHPDKKTQATNARPQIMTAFGLHPAFDDGSFDPARNGIPWTDIPPQAIGEIGLDKNVPVEMDRQCQRFEMMLDLASQLGLPVVLHARAPWNILFASLDRFPRVKGLAHAFGGSREVAAQLIRRGYLLSAGPRLLDPRARRLRETFSSIPLESIVIESDAPDMAPRDTTPPNEPTVVLRIAASLASLRGETKKAIASAARTNLLRLLKPEAEIRLDRCPP
jgi:TatD DNase family protein